MFKIRQKKTNGFTLLEVMVAISILAIAMTTLLGNQNQSLQIADESGFYFVSSLLVREKMTELRLSDGEIFSTEGDFGENYPGYFWSVEVEPPDFSEQPFLSEAEPFLSRVELTVYTEDKKRSYSMRRYLLVGTK